MARSTKTTATSESGGGLHITKLEHIKRWYGLQGISPLVLNSMSLKAKHDLLFPTGRLNTAARASRLKHDPLPEYQASIYKRPSDTIKVNGVEHQAPTRILFPAPALKSVMATASLEMAGVTKASIERLTWVDGRYIDIWGVPKLMMSVVRNSDMKKTPDIRTRAIIEEWCAIVPINFVTGKLNDTNITNLLYNGGMICGIGDWRQEKGSGSNGRFIVCPVLQDPETMEVRAEEDNPMMNILIEEGGLAAQDAAIAEPEFYDADSEEMYFWFQKELVTRGESSKRRGKKGDEDLAEVATVVASQALDAGFPVDETPATSGLTPAQMERARSRNGSNGRGRK